MYEALKKVQGLVANAGIGVITFKYSCQAVFWPVLWFSGLGNMLTALEVAKDATVSRYVVPGAIVSR